MNHPLPAIPYTTVTLVHLGFNRKVLKQEGFGYLIPSKEQSQILGMVWDSSAFPEQNSHPEETRLTLMIQGHPSKPELDTLTQQALNQHLQCDQSPTVISITTAKSAIPQYLVGHQDTINQLKRTASEKYPQLSLCGTAFNGVSINDCVAETSRLYQI